MEIRYGIAESIGLRPRMEDSHTIWDVAEEGLFAAEVFDGHGGSLAATVAAEGLTPHILSLLRDSRRHEDVGRMTFREMVRKGYLSTDTYIIGQGIECGTAGATLHIMDGRFCAANVGDSRVVIDTDREAVQLTVDHKPDLPTELERIEAMGGRVTFHGVPRLQGYLAMSRALGDQELRPFLTPEPRVVEGRLGRENRFALIACDGVWDVLSLKEAMEIARGKDDPQKAADAIERRARDLGSTDNITVIVLDLRAYTGGLDRQKMEILGVLDKGLLTWED